ncbi:hypothetical protein [Glycomyces sp. NRRL B-16210]|uniref:hypothetical protein n=1 Tax=Glycomyces sp. NRRL B-16210 TaxID=1463821 RepID=UPI00105EF67B|nr:hypothetical protein [Glycomyces sp. NRRL B-16210]
MKQPAVQLGTAKSEVLGEWLTDNRNRLTLMARPGTGYASVWLSYHGQPVKIGRALHAGGVVREVSWEGLWAEQTDTWKSQQRSLITALIAARHAGQSPAPKAELPSSVLGTFNIDGFRFAVEPTLAPEHAILSAINVAGGLTPVADLLHENGRICGMAPRPGGKSTPEDRKRQWRRETEAILTHATTEGRI